MTAPSTIAGRGSGYVPVRGKGGMLRLTDAGWRYFAAEESLRAEPIGDPLRCYVLTAEEVRRYFGNHATFDGFEVAA